MVGGTQKESAHRRAEWDRHRQGIVVRVDPERGESSVCATYVSPPEVCPDGARSVLHKSATLQGDHLFACTQTEVLIYSLPSFEVQNHVSLPVFNDVHHVRPTRRGTLLVVSTGLDLLLETTLDGEVVREWDVLGREPHREHPRDRDYRKVPSTKPHASHPNYVFLYGDDIWITRFEQRDAVQLTGGNGRIAIGLERPHDGHVVDYKVYFTTVDGHVVLGNLRTEARETVYDLNEFVESDFALGWCRGMVPLGSDLALVGFSRIRPTRTLANLRWAKHKMGLRNSRGSLPTRVCLFDLTRGCMLWEHDLEGAGLNVLFSIHVVPEHLR